MSLRSAAFILQREERTRCARRPRLDLNEHERLVLAQYQALADRLLQAPATEDSEELERRTDALMSSLLGSAGRKTNRVPASRRKKEASNLL